VVSEEQIKAVQGAVEDLLAAEGVVFDAQQMCLHHPDAVVARLKGPCGCRKPAPGMLSAILDYFGANVSGSWMVGDTDVDILAGQRAGVRTVLVQNPCSGHKRVGQVYPDLAVGRFAEAVPMMLAAVDIV
jgi:histidinol-phosphate phosphatase family protein